MLASELNELLARVSGDEKARQAAVEQRGAGLHFSFLDTFNRRERWEFALEALENLGAGLPKTKGKAGDRRLVWVLSSFGDISDSARFNPEDVVVRPREQCRTARGKWSKGRNLKLYQLFEHLECYPFITDHDRRIVNVTLVREPHLGHKRGLNEIDFSEVVVALCGHPLVFWDYDPETPVEIVRREPHLSITEVKGWRRVCFEPPPPRREGSVVVTAEGLHLLHVYEYTREQMEVGFIVGDGLNVPKAGAERVQKVLSLLSGHVNVHTDDTNSLQGERVKGSPVPRVRFRTWDGGYRVAVEVVPGPDGAAFEPGVGCKIYVTEHEKRRLLIERDLTAEITRAEQVYALSETLAEVRDGHTIPILRDHEEILEVLLGLRKMGDRVVVEWPGNAPLVEGETDVSGMHLVVRKNRDWFTLEGELRINENLTIDLGKLLDLFKEDGGRFVRLDERRFIALTERLRRRILEIRSLTRKEKKSLKLITAAALFPDTLTAEVGRADIAEAWDGHVEEVREAMLAEYEHPSLLQAQLREYQREGFQWLCRLAAAGFGACLADDMGLGKTIQSLALLLHRAPHGAALIIAPTSVISTWEGEIRRFAPALRLHRLNDRNRKEIVNNAGAFDVVACSYGILVSEKETLCGRDWATIILDEAQAIKNVSAKRSRTAMDLRAVFRMVTTGTPVENHLGELWTIMRFLNPGLLGTLQQFRNRFAIPIEQNNDTVARRRLHRLVNPFILRRTKGQVLDELPPKTEVLVEVELSEEEASFYEALRKKALDELDKDKG
ncbi:MAG: ATP-dependent helicase, partial [Chitinivibrionales bacterium]|nr:ATP-dependent helicase [Chitinivibrionales bacterium]